MSLIRTVNLEKKYVRGEETLVALKGISLEISEGEFVSIMGPSGSGKSTLLQIIGTLDLPTSGELYFKSKSLVGLSDHSLALFRRKNLGFVFQFFNLLPTLSALENVLLPLSLDGRESEEFRSQALELLERVGLKARAHHRPDQLSGGEMQRVALARALIHKPALLLADEPTGNLDSKNGENVLSLLREISRQKITTLVMVTHDAKAATYGTRTVTLRDGLLDGDTLC